MVGGQIVDLLAHPVDVLIKLRALPAPVPDEVGQVGPAVGPQVGVARIGRTDPQHQAGDQHDGEDGWVKAAAPLRLLVGHGGADLLG